MLRNAFALTLLILLLAACQGPERTVHPAFYHWQSRFMLTEPELECLEKTGAQRIYLRLFDVDWSEEGGGVLPISILGEADSPPKGVEIVPTIYLTNRSLLETPIEEIDTMKGRIRKLMFSVIEQYTLGPVAEVQIDCDWSSQTRKKYFRLLAGLQEDLHARQILLSVTIRLHQLKYRHKTGIPPADRGMLMYYNMGDLRDTGETNSILNPAVGESYLTDFETYPLPLDVALPIFAWGVVQRQGKTVFLLNGLRNDEADRESGLEKIGPNRYKVLESHYFRGEYLYQGDLIRTEAVSDSALTDAAELLARTLHHDSLNVALYHLDSLTISHYDLETFAAVWNAFH